MDLIIQKLTENRQKIAELIDAFSQSISRDYNKSNILDFMHKVSFCTENFFFDEEMFLKKYKILTYELHVNEHKRFIEKMIYFQKKLENDETDVKKELFDYINDWYHLHILKNDEEIIEFIKKVMG